MVWGTAHPKLVTMVFHFCVVEANEYFINMFISCAHIPGRMEQIRDMLSPRPFSVVGYFSYGGQLGTRLVVSSNQGSDHIHKIGNLPIPFWFPFAATLVYCSIFSEAN